MRLQFVAPWIALVTLAHAAYAQIPVMDQRGKTVVLAAPAERIATIPMPAASMLVATDGSARRLLAMNPASMSAVREGPLGRLYPALKTVRTDIIRGGQFQPNVEALLALQTDVVFQWAHRGDELIAPLEAAGLRVLGMTYGAQSDVEGTLIMMGAVVGKSENAKRIIESFAAKRVRLETALKGLSEQERPKVLYLQRFTHGLRTSAGGSYADFALRLAGGRNAAAGAKGTGVEINFEQALAWAPQVIVVGGFDNALPAELLDDPTWRAVPAVREGRVYKMPLGGYRWDYPSQESALAWTWLSQLLHPTRVMGDLRAEIRALYSMLYDVTIDDATIDAILRIGVNRRSRDYTRLFARAHE